MSDKLNLNLAKFARPLYCFFLVTWQGTNIFKRKSSIVLYYSFPPQNVTPLDGNI